MQYSSKKIFRRKNLIFPLAVLLTGCVSNPLLSSQAVKKEAPISTKQTATTSTTPVPSQELQSYISTLNMAESNTTPSPLLEKSLQLSKTGQHQSALEQLALFKKQNTATTASSTLLEGIIQYNAGNIDAAEKLFSTLTTDHPEYPEGFNNLAVIHAEKGNYPKAIETLQKSFQSHSSYKHIYSNLKALYATLASEAYSKALDLNDTSIGPELLMLNSLTKAQALPSEASQQVATISSSLKKAPATASVKSPVPKPINIEASASESEISQSINQHLTNWAKAWSQQNSEDYIAAYTDDYRPTPQLTHQQWIAQREVRLSKPLFIRIALSNIDINVLTDDLAEAYVIQRYESDTYQDAVRKRLMLIKSEGQWKISLEQSLGLVE